MSQENTQLAARCREYANAAARARTWLDNNRELVRGEYDALRAELRRAERTFHKCESAARRKMCVGVFGPSQSGKSYLVSVLARGTQPALMVELGPRQEDFVAAINPAGGKESTGLVTRFTTTLPSGAPEGFPVKLRLLSEADVAKILANTYYADCDHKEAPDQNAVLETLARLDARAQAGPVAGNPLDQEEMEELKEYVSRRFQSRPRVQLLDKIYWQRAAQLAPRLGLEDRAALFGLIWDGVEALTKLFLRLCGALDRLGNPEDAWCPYDALLPREGSIIDVAMLQGLEQGGGGPLRIAGPQGQSAELSRSEVAALTAEICMPIREKPDDYFEHTDLLDFPGYRSRLKLEDLRRELEREGTLENLFLRGKVAYLFERYCAEKELTSMLLCIGPGNQEVQDLPGAVDEWVRGAHGETPARRTDKEAALFFVLTKMDMEFEKKAGALKVEGRWKTRLAASLLDFFGKQHDWPLHWDDKGAFRNTFLLRNPNFKCEATFDFDGNRERAVRADQLAYVEELRQDFLNTPEVRTHFAEAEQAWGAAMTLNDGGVAYLCQKLRPLCNPQLKREQIATALADRLDKLRSSLAPFRQADSKEEERAQKEALSRTLAGICAEIVQKQRFGEFLRLLQVTDRELYDVHMRAEQALLAQEAGAGQANVTGVRVFADDLLGDVFGAASAPAVQQPQDGKPGIAPARDEAGRFAQQVQSYWIERLHGLAGDPEVQNAYAFPSQEFGLFVHELTTAVHRTGLMRDMEESLRKAGGYGNIARDRLIWKQVSLAAGFLNAFVDWLGYNPRTRSEQERTIIVNGRACVLFAPPQPVRGGPLVSEQQTPYDRTWYTDWLRALVSTLMENTRFDGTRTINIEQNTLLKEILNSLTV
ncbi:MAG: putative virulence factor [Deltaproteobacteria bacterium]|jgi:hypothetical protein|nr:putative virulence factor [Deltaproteobacteria bacterium]